MSRWTEDVHDPAKSEVEQVRTRVVTRAVRAIDALQDDRFFASNFERLDAPAQEALLSLRDGVRALRALR